MAEQKIRTGKLVVEKTGKTMAVVHGVRGRRISVRKATENKSARITWSDGESSLSIDFAKGAGRAQVVVQHQILKDSKEAERMKKFWLEHLEKFKALLEKQDGLLWNAFPSVETISWRRKVL